MITDKKRITTKGKRIMEVTFYKQALCPRCHLAAKHLQELLKQTDGFILEEVDIVAQPLRSWRDGIRMIPAIKVGDDILSGIYLTKPSIEKFLKDKAIL